MPKMCTAIRLLAACLVAGAFHAGHADAQDKFGDLSTYIKQTFPSDYKAGTLGRDWCYNTEVEELPNYWYMEKVTVAARKFEAIDVQKAIRIQVIHDTAKGRKGFASVFLGFAFPASTEYAKILFEPYRSTVNTAAALDKASTPLKLKEPSQDDACMTLAQFLAATISNEWQLADLILDESTNPKDYDDRTKVFKDADNGSEYRYWRMGNRYHKVRTIRLMPISLNDPNSQATSPVVGHLLLGFGGTGAP